MHRNKSGRMAADGGQCPGRPFLSCKFVYFGFYQRPGKITRKLTFSMQAAIVAFIRQLYHHGHWPQLLAKVLPHGNIP